MEVGEANAIAGKLVYVGSPDLAAEARKITEAQVVSDYDEEVWTLLGAICCV